jgi:predicted CoA-binding protein
MDATREDIRDFLAQRRIAVAGVSRDPQQTGNHVFRKLEACGYEVFPVNPRAAEAEGVRCYPDLRSVPPPVDGVVVVTRPADALALVRECEALGIRRVWMHRSFGAGSVSDEAARLGRERGMTVIAGGCPFMYLEPVDPFHRCFRWLLGVQGKLPR